MASELSKERALHLPERLGETHQIVEVVLRVNHENMTKDTEASVWLAGGPHGGDATTATLLGHYLDVANSPSHSAGAEIRLSLGSILSDCNF